MWFRTRRVPAGGYVCILPGNVRNKEEFYRAKIIVKSAPRITDTTHTVRKICLNACQGIYQIYKEYRKKMVVHSGDETIAVWDVDIH